MSSTVYQVSNAAELRDALLLCRGGETVELAAGNYGALKMSRFEVLTGQYDSTVTIRSADPDAPATFSWMNLNGAKNMTIDGVVFDYTFKAGDAINKRPFEVASCDNIVIRNSVFDGDVATGVSATADGFGYGQGLSVRGSTNVAIEGNEFFDWHRGAVFSHNDKLVVSGNELHSMRSDGMNFATVTNVLIENNYLHDFKGSVTSGDHRDMIQFWTTGTTRPSTDIIIRGNTLDIGNGNWTQSIFMRNEMVDTKQAGSEMFYRNVTIEDNVIYNAHIHGITVGETDGLTIRNNSIIAVRSAIPGETDGSGVWIPAINLKTASTNVALHDNVVSRINGVSDKASWSLSDNVFIQNSDPLKPGFYDHHFVSSSMTRGPDGHSYVVLPGSIIETLGAGAPRLLFDDAPDSVVAMFESAKHDTNDRTMIFDATLTVAADGALVQDKALFHWDFGDGTTATGLVVAHSYKDAGRYTATLTVIAPDGSTSQSTRPVGIDGAAMLSYDETTGRFVTHRYGVDGAGADMSDRAMATGTGMGLVLGGTGATKNAGSVARLFNADSFDLSLTLQAKPGIAANGEVLRVHTTLLGTVSAAGNFSFSLTTGDGKIHTITTSGVTVNDGAKHDIRITFDGTAGEYRIFVDGTMAASKTVFGQVGPQGSWGLVFGNPWGKKNFEGVLHDLDFKVNQVDYPAGATAVTEVIRDNGVTEPPAADRILEAVGPQNPVIETGESEGVSDSSDEAFAEDGDVPEAVDEAASGKEARDATGDVPGKTGEVPPPAPAGPVLEAGYALDLAALAEKPGRVLNADAHIATHEGQMVLRMDGWQDHANLGRLTEFERSDRLAFAVEFRRDEADGSVDRLVWNHLKLGLTLQGDGLAVQVATADQGFRNYSIKDLGLNDTNMHRAVVMVDQVQDRLQVFVDDKLVLDRSDSDFQFTGAGGRESGWMLGTPWNRYFDGDVASFQVTDKFAFLDAPVHGQPQDNSLFS